MLKRAKAVLRRARFQAGSSRLGSKANTKKHVLVGSDPILDSIFETSTGFGATDGRVLVTLAIPGLMSLAVIDGPVPASFGLESSVQAFGSDASVVTGTRTSGPTSSVAVFGPVPESFGPKSFVQASLPFDQAFSVQPYAQAFFFGCSLGAAPVLAEKVDSATKGSSPVPDIDGLGSFGTTFSGSATLGETHWSVGILSTHRSPNQC
jgi:hypothetical protein